MGEVSGIAWTDGTFNPWIGCTKISPACDNCYAEQLARTRLKVLWGPGAPRRRTSIQNWKAPLAWNRKCEKEGTRKKVFCASLADVFDNEIDPQWRADLWDLIRVTPNLDWLLLTKRIGNVKSMFPVDWCEPLENVWLGITVVNQMEVDRDVPKLIEIPAKVRFLSVEPMLGPISFVGRFVDHEDAGVHDNWLENLQWVICGGESGSKARTLPLEWAEWLQWQCEALKVPFFMKQLSQADEPLHFKDFDSFPESLRVREFPR